ncbi:uncharacterized protein LOC141534265 isoform X1 [Cotesia typhae]|uniref:uncharacterized protein LOC141534265 isoform X1 n=1 Tax=Cotesia typhae TaxID=2053667 RepID=UPI003D6862DD
MQVQAELPSAIIFAPTTSQDLPRSLEISRTNRRLRSSPDFQRRTQQNLDIPGHFEKNSRNDYMAAPQFTGGKPPLSTNWREPQYKTECSTQMAEQIETLASQGVLEKVSEPGPSFVSKMFLVKKSDGGWRPIFDLRSLNRYVETREFHLISHAKVPDFIQPGDWLIRVDMSQACFHIRVASSHRCFLRLLFRGELWQMTSLPFGLSAAPQAFSTVTNWVAETLRSRGLRVLVYLDDFLVACQNKNELVAQVSMMIELLEALGWQINRSKSILKPCQDLKFLGIRWNVERKEMSLSEKKIAKIIKVMTDIERAQSCTLKEARCLLGHLNFASFVVPRGQLHCRYLQRFLTRFNQSRPRERRQISSQIQDELAWWAKAASLTSPLHKSEVTHFLVTDASDLDWGAQLNAVLMSGHWSKSQRKWHSNKKEMLAVYQALAQQGQCLRGAHILLQSDNRTVVSYIRKEGGTRSVELYSLTYQLLTLVDELQIMLSAYYLPGRYNGTADRLSRKRALPE